MSHAIETDRTYLRPLTAADATADYAAWLNDPEVNRYLETRHTPQTIASCAAFIADCNNDPRSHLFGIFLRGSDAHIGNAKIGFINPHYRTGQLSLFIGDKSQWGKGIAGEVVTALTAYGFDQLGLQRIEAGCYAPNEASLKIFQRAGYRQEGRFRSHVELDGERLDVVWLGILPGELAA